MALKQLIELFIILLDFRCFHFESNLEPSIILRLTQEVYVEVDITFFLILCSEIYCSVKTEP